MKHLKWILSCAAILIAVFAVVFVLKSEKALLTHPKGIIAQRELHLIGINYLLMLIVILPTLVFLFVVVWRYRAKNAKAKHEPEHRLSVFKELLLWIVPSIVIAVMTVITWKAAHELDPYEPIKSDVEPLVIQVVAIDWKWLFIYPQQEIATVNFVQFPANTPIHFKLAADGSPMNSFWIPQLSGQIYSMTGMTTQLHMMADAPGTYSGRAAEINGEGYADMTFVAQSTSQADFEEWVTSVKQQPLQLTEPVYNELLKPSRSHPVALYASVEKDLFNKIVMKYMDCKCNCSEDSH
jgi:cytochrome o ubiquinol oxidase subunit 2